MRKTLIATLGGAIVLALTVSGAQATAIQSYTIYQNGPVTANPFPTYGSVATYIELDAANNAILFKGSSFEPLNTNLFTVGDITEVTAEFGGSVIAQTATGSYQIFSDGSAAAVAYPTYGSTPGYIELDAANNAILFQGGTFQPLNTNLLTVSDITDVTAEFGVGSIIAQTATGSYQIFQNGTAVAVSYPTYGSLLGYVELDAANDSILFQGSTFAPLNTNLFTVSDITDVTAEFGGSVIVNVSSPTEVPEPATWTMLLFGFLGIGFMARRVSAKGDVAQA